MRRTKNEGFITLHLITKLKIKMFKALKRYITLNPINTATCTICSTSVGITLVDIISDGKVDFGNITSLGLAGLATSIATISSVYQKRHMIIHAT